VDSVVASLEEEAAAVLVVLGKNILKTNNKKNCTNFHNYCYNC
jgi:hypothetical protein